MTMDVPSLLSALAHLLWPIATVILVVFGVKRFGPVLIDVIQKRPFKVKYGEVEVSFEATVAQTATLMDDLKDLRERVQHLEQGTGQAAPKPQALPGVPVPPQAAPGPKKLPRILWVDDNPENNAYAAGLLTKDGVQVVQARSTEHATKALTSYDFSAIVTDIGRTEAGKFIPDAGVQFIKAARDYGFQGPIIAYTRRQTVERRQGEIISAGANHATSSQSELLLLLAGVT